jgi:hypothetical protein
MERRSLLGRLFSVSARTLTNGNCLTSSDQREVRAIRRVLSRLYDRKLTVAKLRRGKDILANYALSPLETPARTNLIPQYEIAKMGRREFLTIGGAVMAIAVGGALYYVSPGFRTLTTTVTRTLTEPATAGTTQTTINTYRMTASTVGKGYYLPAGMEWGYEMHFKTARRGKIEDMRRALETEGTEHFQKTMHDEFGRTIPKRRIRVGFEREEPTTRVQSTVLVESTYLEYQGGKWESTAMPSKVLRYAKRA